MDPPDPVDLVRMTIYPLLFASLTSLSLHPSSTHIHASHDPLVPPDCEWGIMTDYPYSDSSSSPSPSPSPSPLANPTERGESVSTPGDSLLHNSLTHTDVYIRPPTMRT